MDNATSEHRPPPLPRASSVDDLFEPMFRLGVEANPFSNHLRSDGDKWSLALPPHDPHSSHNHDRFQAFSGNKLGKLNDISKAGNEGALKHETLAAIQQHVATIQTQSSSNMASSLKHNPQYGGYTEDNLAPGNSHTNDVDTLSGLHLEGRQTMNLMGDKQQPSKSTLSPRHTRAQNCATAAPGHKNNGKYHSSRNSPRQTSRLPTSPGTDSLVLTAETHTEDHGADSSDSPNSESKGEGSNLEFRKPSASCVNCAVSSNGKPCSHNGSAQSPPTEEEMIMVDERKQKRMISNRESARRSRLRKQQHLDELRLQVQKLQNENAEMLHKFGLASQHFAHLNEENRGLRTHAMDLSRRLQQLHHAAEAQGLPEIDLGLSHMDTFMPGYNSAFPLHRPPIPPYPHHPASAPPFQNPYGHSMASELSR